MPPEEEREKTVTLSRNLLKELRGPEEEDEQRLRVRQGLRPGMLTVAIVVVSWVASLVGVMLCFVGVIFTMPYVNFVYGHLLGQIVAARRIQ